MRNSILGMLDKARRLMASHDRLKSINPTCARYFHRCARYWITQARLVRARVLLAGTPSYLPMVGGGYSPCIRVGGKPEVVYWRRYPHRQSASRVAQKALAKLTMRTVA